MSTEKIIRSQAKKSLRGKWVTAICGLFTVFAFILLVFVFYFSLCEIFNIFNSDGYVSQSKRIPLVVIILITFLLGFALSPVKNGYFRLCCKIAENREAEFRDVFYFIFGIKEYLRALSFNICILARMALFFIIGFIPFFILNMLNGMFVDLFATVTANKVLYVLSELLIIAGVTYGLVQSLTLFISEFMFAQGEHGDTHSIFRTERAIRKKHHSDLIILTGTFLLWLLLCFFVLPAIYVLPYFTVSMATSSKWLIKLYKDGKMQ